MLDHEELTGFVRKTVHDLLCQRGKDICLGDDESFGGSGRLDSLSFVKLIAAVEERFDIEVELFEFEPERFLTISGFCSCVMESE